MRLCADCSGVAPADRLIGRSAPVCALLCEVADCAVLDASLHILRRCPHPLTSSLPQLPHTVATQLGWRRRLVSTLLT